MIALFIVLILRVYPKNVICSLVIICAINRLRGVIEMNEKLIEEIKSEIAFCDREMRSALTEIAKTEMRRSCLSDRKAMLQHLLELAEKEK